MAVTIVSDDQFQELVSTLRRVDKRLDQLAETVSHDSAELLDNEDLCRIFKCTTRTLQNWRDKGILPYVKLEGSNNIIYRRCDVEELINKSHSKSGKHGG